MSTRFRLAILLVIGMVALAGCSGDDTGDTPEPETEEPTEDPSELGETDGETPGDEIEPPAEDGEVDESSPPDEGDGEAPEIVDDNTAPEVAVLHPNDGYTADEGTNQLMVEFAATDDESGVDFETLRVRSISDGDMRVLTHATQQSGAEVTVPVSVEDGGEYRVVITVSDHAGNMASTAVSFSVAGTQETTIDPVDPGDDDDGEISYDDPYIPPPTEPDNNAPSAVADADATLVEVNTPIVFDGSASSDPDEDDLTYQWDFDNGESESGVTASHAFTEAGVYIVQLTVDDGWSGGTDTDEVEIEVVPPSEPPVADAGEDKYALTSETVQFDASASSDPEGDELTYHWDFGDGTVLTDAGPTPTHTFGNPDTYEVEVTVEDSVGQTDTDTVLANIRDENGAPVADAGEDKSILNMTTARFDGSASSDPEDDDLTYEWDFDDGNSGSGEVAEHKFTERGTYSVALTVTDPWGASDTDSATVEVQNNPPEAQVTPPEDYGTTTDDRLILPVDGTLEWAGSESSDIDGDSLAYTWTFDDGTTANGETVEHTYTTEGDYTVTMEVDDGHGGIDTEEVPISVQSVDPVADAGDDKVTALGYTVEFDGTDSYDPNEGSLSYEWALGDGTTKTGATVTHEYSQTGDIEVTLTVTDADGNTDTDTLIVEVREDNTAPTADATGPSTISFGDGATLDGSGSSDPDGDSLTYTWYIDQTQTEDGSTADYSDTTMSEIIEYDFPEPGEYEATLEVEDEVGDTDTDLVTVVVESNDPVADAGADDTHTVGFEYTFDATDSYDPDGSQLTYEWDFNEDGTTDATGAEPTYTYDSTGEYVVAVTVTDEYGNTDTDTMTIVIENEQPVANAGEDMTVVVGNQVQFDGTDSSDPDGHDMTYEWDFDEDGVTDATGPEPTHTYDSTGEYIVELTVKDGYGGTSTDTITVTVTE